MKQFVGLHHAFGYVETIESIIKFETNTTHVVHNNQYGNKINQDTENALCIIITVAGPYNITSEDSIAVGKTVGM